MRQQISAWLHLATTFSFQQKFSVLFCFFFFSLGISPVLFLSLNTGIANQFIESKNLMKE